MKSIPTSPSSSDIPTPPRPVPYFYENLAHDWLEPRTGLRQALRHLEGTLPADPIQAAAHRWVRERIEAALHVLEEKWPADIRAAYDQDHARFEADIQRRQQRHTKVGIPRRRRAPQRAAAD